MVDPENPPKLPGATQAELEEFLWFSIAVAGHNAANTAVGIDKFINSLPAPEFEPARPLARLARWQATECFRLPCDATGWDGGWSLETRIAMLAELVKQAGLGCHSQRAASFLDLMEKVGAGLDIATCTVEQLEDVHGIGKKTSRFFVMYTRPGKHRYAILDVHILDWLRSQGYQAPKHTPKATSTYNRLEQEFIREADARGVTPLELDAAIWKARRKS
jgi:hypothetical protein